MKSYIVCPMALVLSLAFAGCSKIPFIGKKGGQEGVASDEVLVQALQDKNPVVRRDAVRLLGEMIDTPENQAKSARALAVALKDRDEEIRLEAVKTLGNIDPIYSNRYLKEALSDRSIKVRVLVIQVMKQQNEKRITEAKQKALEKEKEAQAAQAAQATQAAQAPANPLLAPTPTPTPPPGQ
ncbi:HEAT repeat domain-containing protein [bacterium]|nr:HEAT repeat domain-containing protein [bacterium]